MCISVACQWWCLCWVHAFFLWCREHFQSSSEYFLKVAVKGHPWRLLSRGGSGTAELSNCLHTNEMSQRFCLFVFIPTPSFSRSYHNIFQDEFTLSFWSSLVSIEIHHLELRPLCTNITYKLEMYVESACFYLSSSHHASWGSLSCLNAWI